jgi:hypothetical protein
MDSCECSIKLIPTRAGARAEAGLKVFGDCGAEKRFAAAEQISDLQPQTVISLL